MGSHAAKLVAFCLVVGCLVGAAPAAAAPAIDGTFPLDSELGSNNKIAAGPDGNIWVTASPSEPTAPTGSSSSLRGSWRA